MQDLRLACRLLARHPGFSIVSIVTLALAIGANTAIFSVVDGVLLRPAPVDDLDGLVMVWETDRNTGTTREPASVPDFVDFQERSRGVRDLGAFMGEEVNLALPDGEPVRLAALRVSHRLLPMLGLTPLLGRGFRADEDRAAGPKVALISESLWDRALGRDPAAVGRILRLDEVSHTVVGVMPDVADFGVLQILSAGAYSRSFADRGDRVSVDVWMPLQADAESFPRATHPIFVLGRLAPDASVSGAGEELAAISADLERTYPENAARGVFVEPLREVVLGPIRPALAVLLGAVGLVLLVACANIANLLLARGAARSREVAVRTALGAGVARLGRQFLIESLVLALLGGLAGIGLAFAALRTLLAIAPHDVPRLAAITIDTRVLAATAVISLLSGLLFGLVPILQGRRLDLLTALRGDGGSQGTLGPGRGRVRSALVIIEVAVAVVLLVGAGLLIRSFWRLQQVDAGFRADRVLKAEYQLPAARYPVDFRRWPDFTEMHRFTDALLERARVLPGVEIAAIAGNHPLDPGFTNSFRVVGREAEARTWPEISVRPVTPEYFRTVGLSLLRGRALAATDGTSAAPVAVINDAARRRFFAGSDPLGAQISFWGASRTIVGVVANEKFQGLAEASPIAVYVPLAQAPSATGAGVLLVRTAGEPSALATAVRSAIREVDPMLAVFGVEPLTDTVSRGVARRRFTMLLLAWFAALALLLAAIGVHGVLSLGVAERTREIGIRMALGAERLGVVRLVLRQGLTLVLAGLLIGAAAAFAVTRLFSGLLFGVAPTDAVTFAFVSVFLVSVAVVACALPARRATRVDPVVALRGE